MFSFENLSVCSPYFCIIRFCPLLFNISFFLPLFISFSLHFLLYPHHPLFWLYCSKKLSPPLFVINQGSERWHSVGGISREADEISGSHLLALYGDLLGWDKQQASHHSQPNRLPACMCLFLLHCHDHCRCQGWSSPWRPAPW